jgi:O-acetylhomoserine (thiol)-lyase
MEGGVAAVATASGTAAIATTLMVILKTGDHIVASNSLYGGTYNLLSNTLPRFGITTTFVDPDNAENFTKAIQPNTRLFFAESLGNPKLDVLDLKAISEQAKSAKVPFVVDNTVASPALLNPIEHGANIVIHSLTKYLTGNGTSLGGVIIDAGTFDWSNGNFPEFTEPNPSYHGLNYHEALGAIAFIAKVRIEGLRDLGSAPSPFNSFQTIQGIETLDIRMKKHSENALKLAAWLSTKKEVAWVNYPGLQTSRYNELAQKYLPKGQSGIVTFGLNKGFEGGKIVADKTQLFSLLANIGDTKSLIIHPASTTHQQLDEEAQKATGVTPDLIRLSVGLEDVKDLIDDLENAFASL